MKRIRKTTILLIALTTFIGHLPTACAQTTQLYVSRENGLITYERIIAFDTIKADHLFNRSKAWFVEYFRDSKEVIRGENKPEMIKGTFHTKYAAAMGMTQPYENDITVRIKDGAIKIVIDNFRTAPDGGGGMGLESVGLKDDGTMRTGGMYQKTFKDIESKCHELTNNLQAYILKKSNW